MKDIDEELSAQIAKVFENFDDGHSAQGWAALREKYPEKRSRKIPLWWVSGIAATLLLVCGWWFLANDPKTIENKAPKVATKTEPTFNNSKTEQPLAEDEHPATVTKQQRSLEASKPAQSVAANTIKDPLAGINPQEATAQQTTALSPTYKENPTNSIAINPTIVPKPNTQNVAVLLTDSTRIALEQAKMAGDSQANAVVPKVKSSQKTTEDFLRAQTEIATSKTQTKSVKGSEKSSFEVFTGTFVNYSGNNDLKVNAGFGLNANIKVSQTVFIALGAGFSQNKIGSTYQNSLPTADVNPAVMNSVSSAMYTSTPFATDVKLTAQLLAIDLPIAVKFYPTTKQNFYISTGINSSSYISQEYTYSYTIINPAAFDKQPAAPEEQTEKSLFKGFDFANSAIFAIGIKQRIGTNKLIFEPYFKPAIRAMGDKNLKINTLGLNLRFNFGASGPTKK